MSENLLTDKEKEILLKRIRSIERKPIYTTKIGSDLSCATMSRNIKC